MEKVFRTFWPAGIALIATTILLCLPGLKLPTEDWFDKIHLDKWVHIFLFTVLVCLWSWPFVVRKIPGEEFKWLLLKIGLAGIGYGVAMELVQHFWIPDRSFDPVDILADVVGCGLAFWLVRWRMSKPGGT